MWALESGVLKNFFLRLSSGALDTTPVSLGVNHGTRGWCKTQADGHNLFEWHLCTTVTVSPLIVVEMIHSWGGEKISGHSLSPHPLFLPALKRTISRRAL